MHIIKMDDIDTVYLCIIGVNFSFQPKHYDWINKDHGMCNPVCWYDAYKSTLALNRQE